MTMLEAARMGDQVAHSNALLGFLKGMVAGAVIAVGLALLAGATIATGGGALILAGALLAGAGGGALTGMELGATEKGSTDPIATGALRTFIGRDVRPAARAVEDETSCHAPQKIAEGSETVSIERFPAARRTDQTECGGKIDEGWPTVFIGKEAARYLAVQSEVPSWMVTGAKWAIIVGTGLGLAGGVLVAGIAITALGFGGGLIGGKYGSEWGGQLGERIGGERGRIIGAWLGGEIGGLVGGHLGGKVGQRAAPLEIAAARNALKPFPELSARIARAPGESPTHIGARQNVARQHYETTRPYDGWAARQRDYAASSGKTVDTSPEAYRRDINSHMSGIDFRKPVVARSLEADTPVYTFGKPPVDGVSPDPGSYVGYEKQTPSSIGISDQAGASGQDRALYRGTLAEGTPVLESTASPKLDNFSVRGEVTSTAGGGKQVNVNDPGAYRSNPDTGQRLTPTGETSANFRDGRSPGTLTSQSTTSVPIAGDSGARVTNPGGAIGVSTNDPTGESTSGQSGDP